MGRVPVLGAFSPTARFPQTAWEETAASAPVTEIPWFWDLDSDKHARRTGTDGDDGELLLDNIFMD